MAASSHHSGAPARPLSGNHPESLYTITQNSVIVGLCRMKLESAARRHTNQGVR